MNLFSYTKKLSEKISYYDRLTKETAKNFSMTNPFSVPVNLTVIWVENCDEKDNKKDYQQNIEKSQKLIYNFYEILRIKRRGLKV